MPPCEDTRIECSSVLSRIVTVLLFLLAQVVAALLIGSVALAVRPTQAAELAYAAPHPDAVRAGSLLPQMGNDSHAAKIESCDRARFPSAS